MVYPGSKTNSKKNNINNIIFKDINDDYSFGKYGDFKVIIMKENSYINATKICNDAKTKNGTRKEFRQWKENINANEIINEIVSSIGIPMDELLITPKNVSNEIRGTYAHPDLIPHIASWASPQFAVSINKWFIDQIKNKYYILNMINIDKRIFKFNDTTFNFIVYVSGKLLLILSIILFYCTCVW